MKEGNFVAEYLRSTRKESNGGKRGVWDSIILKFSLEFCHFLALWPGGKHILSEPTLNVY